MYGLYGYGYLAFLSPLFLIFSRFNATVPAVVISDLTSALHRSVLYYDDMGVVVSYN